MRVAVLGGCGYVGSALCGYLEAKGHEVRSYDAEWYGNPGDVDNEIYDCRLGIPYESFDDEPVILLAGHSSVAMCRGEAHSAVRNNVLNFAQIAREHLRSKAPLIYASSVSVYAGCRQVHAHRADLCDTSGGWKNPYDHTKGILDSIAGAYLDAGEKIYGLRFGTVCGPSPNLRTDTMINGMTRSAIKEGVIRVQNPQVFRPLLAMSDLCRAVELCLAADGKPGIYDLVTINDNVQHVAEVVQQEIGAEILVGAPTDGYDMVVDPQLFHREFGFEPGSSIREIVQALAGAGVDGSGRLEPRRYQ